MQHRRWWKAAVLLWVLAVVTGAMSTAGTLARYKAQATGTSSARIATWQVADEWLEEVFAQRLNKDKQEVEIKQAPRYQFDKSATVIFVGNNPYTTTISLENRSEVTARYCLIPDVDDGVIPTLKVTEVKDAGSGIPYTIDVDYGIGSDGSIWVVVPYETKVDMSLAIYPAVFRGFVLDAVVEQVD